MSQIVTERLELRPMTAEVIEALLGGDAARLNELSGAAFAAPVVPPPLMDDMLPSLRKRLRAGRQEARWGSWLILLRGTREPVGSIGFAGAPDERGQVQVGYSIYPVHAGRGYAGEALRGAVAWAFRQAGVRLIRATIPPWHAASLRVAEKAGMRRVGTARNDEVGEVLVYVVERPDPAGRHPRV